MKRAHYPSKSRSTKLWLTLFISVCALTLTGCLEPLPGGPRLVAATGLGQLKIRMSADGVQWTQPQPVVASDGSVANSVALPGLTFDGALYHLHWLEPSGGVRYAISRDAEHWTVQSDAMTRLPTVRDSVPDRSHIISLFGSGGYPLPVSFAYGDGHHIAVLGTWDGVAVVDLNSSTPGAPQPQIIWPNGSTFNPSVVFGNGQFLAAVGPWGPPPPWHPNFAFD
jgi:hypothetical protein